MIAVSRSWDEKEGPVAPKSRKGTRRVPIPASLRLHLLEHKIRTGRDGDELVFGSTGDRSFTPTHVRKQALAAWERANVKRREEELPELTDAYRHLLEGHEAEAAERFEDYLSRSVNS